MADITSTLFAAMIVSAQINIPEAEVTPRFEAECTGGRWESGCNALRNKLEVRLYGEMHTLHGMGLPIPRDQLRVAAKARFPYLAHFALSRLGNPGGPEDLEVVTAALEHPSPAVRSKARSILNSSGDRWRIGIGQWWGPASEEMAPDVMPDMANYGIPALNSPQLRYRFSVSGDARAVFTTKLSPDKALELIASGKRVVTGDRLGKLGEQQGVNQAMEAREQEATAISSQMEEAVGRGDYKTVRALGERLTALQNEITKSTNELQEARFMKPVTTFSAEPSQVRYVKLNPAASLASIAAVGHDDAWGETVIVVTLR
jgi:hypothetical protein